MLFDVQFGGKDMRMNTKFGRNENKMNASFKDVQTITSAGKDGLSAYEVAVKNGFEGTEAEWLASLKGEPGAEGPAGADGKDGKDGKDGNTGPAGKDGSPGPAGPAGADGKDGADGISPSVTVQDIDGGHRVSITDKDGEKVFDVMDGKDGAGGTGGGAAIVDVTALPEGDIDDDVFYRLLMGDFYFNGTPQRDWMCYIVDSLPQEGVPVTTDMVHVSLYYATDTAAVSGYIPPALSSMVGVPAGWYPVEMLGQAFGLAWGGIIWDASEDPIDGANRLVLKYSIYQYKQEWANLSDKIGWRGQSGVSSEVFNTLQNIASGDTSHAEGVLTTASGQTSHAEGEFTTASGYTSHAEGYSTTASGNRSHAEGHSTTAYGYASHAEGDETIASGDVSHAEGYSTTARGYASHAEGYSTTASGNASHAEGDSTTASGEASHAEGTWTIASRRNQHVQGRFNIEDTSTPDDYRHGKYSHIVGNGSDIENPSNAHTLDWNGVAWYQSRPQFGGTAQDDGSQTVMANGDAEIILKSPNGTLFAITISDDGALTATAK